MDKHQLLKLFISVLTDKKKNKKPAKPSSKIWPWLGLPAPEIQYQSISVTMGYLVEDLHNKLIDTLNVSLLSKLHKKGKAFGVYAFNPQEEKVVFNQLDHLFLINDIVYLRESKLNLDLDNGKSRDTVSRDGPIVKEIKKLLNINFIDAAILHPFSGHSFQHSQLGLVEGISDFYSLLDLNLTIDDFIWIGSHPEVKNLVNQIWKIETNS